MPKRLRDILQIVNQGMMILNILKGETYRNRLLLNFLRAPESIRSSCNNLLPYAQRNKLKHFKCNFDNLPLAADYVTKIILRLYPTLNIPYHSRWRHFEAGGRSEERRVGKEGRS